MEIWKEIDGFDGRYKISDNGRVMSFTRNKTDGIEKQQFIYKGYLFVSLQKKNGKSRNYLVHRLVAQAFIENQFHYPQVNHKDENKLNNNVENLEWCTNEYNSNYGSRNKRVSEGNKRYEKRCHKVERIYPKKEVFYSLREAEKKTGISRFRITVALKKNGITSDGSHWAYL